QISTKYITSEYCHTLLKMLDSSAILNKKAYNIIHILKNLMHSCRQIIEHSTIVPSSAVGGVEQNPTMTSKGIKGNIAIANVPDTTIDSSWHGIQLNPSFGPMVEEDLQ
ncbi:hypothetical protein ACJX0J_028692, partial [Zea mays]